MLRKLLKQEFRATARVMLPLYLVTFVLALAVRLVLLLSQNQVLLDSVGGRTLRAILLGVSVTAFVVAAIATFLAALIQAVLRFRSNLLGDESPPISWCGRSSLPRSSGFWGRRSSMCWRCWPWW